MCTNDAESDLDRELMRLKLRDIVIGSAVAAVLLVMMPGHAQRDAASTAGERARLSAPLLPKPKPSCVSRASHPEHCATQRTPQHHAMYYRAPARDVRHSVDIRV
jgi:hypothetical protein